jgi:L-asparaginase
VVRKKIVVLGSGGTIAGVSAQASDNLGYTAAQLGVVDLLQAVPGLARFPLEVVSEQVAQIDSKDMDFSTWQRLLRRCAHWLERDDVKGLVLTHGTDTLEETAYFLQAVLAPTKSVVLTCAMRPASSISADGPQNLLDALTVAAHSGARGVVAVCAGMIHSAQDVQKVHTWRLDAFSSGDVGPIGQVVQGTLYLSRGWPKPNPAFPKPEFQKIADLASWPRVEVVVSHAGASGASVDALVSPEVARSLGAPPVRGLVVAATGNGSVHRELEAALLRAQAAGVRVVRATRCCLGQVASPKDQAIPDSAGLSVVKARVAMMLELIAQPGGSHLGKMTHDETED